MCIKYVLRYGCGHEELVRFVRCNPMEIFMTTGKLQPDQCMGSPKPTLRKGAAECHDCNSRKHDPGRVETPTSGQSSSNR